MIEDRPIRFGAEYPLLSYTSWFTKKTGHYIIGDNFVKCEPIFTIFADKDN